MAAGSPGARAEAQVRARAQALETLAPRVREALDALVCDAPDPDYHMHVRVLVDAGLIPEDVDIEGSRASS